MALTEDQFKTLCARAIVDPNFRKSLLDKPKAAAKQLDMKLSKKDEARIAENVKRIKAHGARVDKVLTSDKFLLIFGDSAPVTDPKRPKLAAPPPKDASVSLPKKRGK